MADLAGPAVGAVAQAAVDHHAAADPGAQGQADHGRAAGGRAHTGLGQGEGAGVVDERDRDAEASGQRPPDPT
ncbi:MAG TPA: hypothetical protein VFQ04_00460, partial [Actinomycetes bacterium]|nr:hypothetical protein [Actinomycetes bacterium]